MFNYWFSLYASFSFRWVDNRYQERHLRVRKQTGPDRNVEIQGRQLLCKPHKGHNYCFMFYMTVIYVEYRTLLVVNLIQVSVIFNLVQNVHKWRFFHFVDIYNVLMYLDEYLCKESNKMCHAVRSIADYSWVVPNFSKNMHFSLTLMLFKIQEICKKKNFNIKQFQFSFCTSFIPLSPFLVFINRNVLYR